MNCNEKMDNTRFGFSGIAGFNKWHYFQGNEYGVWENIIRAEQHMNGQDVRNVIGSDYIQGRQQEELFPLFSWDWGPLAGLENGEGLTIEMQYYLTGDKNNAVGFVYNRTVNYRTAGITSDCRSQPFGDDYLNFDQITNIDWTDDGPNKKLKIRELPTGEDYDVYFYGHSGMDYIFTSHVSTGTNDKLIIEFPELTKEYPVVWFVCNKVGSRNEATSAGTNENLTSDKFSVYPNPTTGLAYLSKDLGTFEVFNSLGMKVIIPNSEVNSEITNLDLRGFAKGIYYIYFSENGQTVKICLL
jgi:hypothetical protein